MANPEQLDKISPVKKALLALKKLQAKVDRLENEKTEPIAIIGMGCRFPGGVNSPEQFWELLQKGKDAVAKTPKERWDIDTFYDPDPDVIGKMYVRTGGFVDDIDQFDASFFGISPREAVMLDPQQRLWLEVCWEALERANIPAKSLNGSKTGIFVGTEHHDYLDLATNSTNQVDMHTATGNMLSITSGRLAYFLGTQGPALTIDTACSASLVAIHQACQSLRMGESTMALAGGVNLILSPLMNILGSRARAFSPDGRCKAFAASGDGYGRGEGCGVLILKRLSDALADDNPILATIRGSAITHDGQSSGLTVPNGLSQQRVIRNALENAKVAADDIDYVETHGTGTPLGDPIEIEALGAVFGDRKHPLLIGSVKTNLSHLEAAAGVAAMIKTVLSIQHQQIPPHLHFDEPNPSIDWDNLALEVPTTLHPWPTNKTSLAGVSSFSLSGTNVHAILEQAPVSTKQAVNKTRPSHLLTLSAKTENALLELRQRYAHYIEELLDEPKKSATTLEDICFSSNIGGNHFEHRLSFMATSLSALHHKIKAPHRQEHHFKQNPNVVFLFSGQGSQYVNMGRQLYTEQSLFREVIDQCDTILRPYLKTSVYTLLYDNALSTNDQNLLLNQTAYTQPVLFCFEYALAKLWQSWGIEPDVVMGHSVGEYVAACIAGVFSLEDGLKLIAERGRLMQALPQKGEMVVVELNETRTRHLIRVFSEDVSIAALNGPQNTVISGTRHIIQALVENLKHEGVKTKVLTVSHAFHSPLMEPMLSDFERIAHEITYSSPQIALISNLTGELITTEIASAEYWCRHIRQPVRFEESMQQLHQQGYDVFVEIGPKPVLLGMGQLCLTNNNAAWLPSLRQGQDDWAQITTTLGKLYEQGSTIDWGTFNKGYGYQKTPLPTYPFQRKSYWITPQQHPLSELNQQKQQPHQNNSLYDITWELKPRKDTSLAVLETGSWLIFADQTKVGETLTELLTEQGHTVFLVYPKTNDITPTTKENNYYLNPMSLAECDVLFMDIPLDKPLHGIIHLWSLDMGTFEENLKATSPDKTQALNCASTLHLTQALLKQNLTTRLWFVTQGAVAVNNDLVSVTQASLWGLGKVMALEYPQLWGGLLDLPVTRETTDTLDFAATILTEIWDNQNENQLAFRSGQRYVARLSAFEPPPETKLPFFLSPDASYLITGGLGELGLQLTRWLIQKGAKHLVLIGRQGIKGKETIITELMQQTSVKIYGIKADVTQAEDLSKVMHEIENSMPPLRGIIHAAGILDDGILLQQNWERFSKVMAPKITGSWNLYNQTKAIPLDFFALFSSGTSMLGTAGQGSYAAANAFMDALAQYGQTQGLPTLSICWAGWDAGMAARLDKRQLQRGANRGIDLIPPKEGVEVFETLLNLLPKKVMNGQIGVLPIDWTDFENNPLAQHPLLTNLISQSQVEQTTILAQLENTLADEKVEILNDYLKTVVASTLGTDELAEVQQGFFDMGMDSLIAIELSNTIQKDLKITFPSTIIFEYPSIESLNDYLLNEILFVTSPQPPSPSINPILNAISEEKESAIVETLSETDLEALIAQELAEIRGGQ